MKSNRYIEIFLITVFIFFFLLYFIDMYANREYILINKQVRNAIEYKESFTDLSPANSDASYSLLDGVLPLKGEQNGEKLNSQTCYESDFETRLERTGNYLQRTNNYRHKDPESCTSPKQEFVTAYYKVEPIS